MKILHCYILQQLLRNFVLTLAIFSFLFLLFDFFDRIDNILAEDASVGITLLYFLCKIPLMISLMLPIATMVATLLTIGMLAKNSELTAMRAAGVAVRSLALPVMGLGLACSFGNLLLNETVVPYSLRRAKEIYNIDIRRKDSRGGYSQNDFWWRGDGRFYSAGMFDSRTRTLHNLSIFDLSDQFKVTKRADAATAQWINRSLGWSMQDVQEYRFSPEGKVEVSSFRSLPLPIFDNPKDFFDVDPEPYTMTMRQLRRFIEKQVKNGVSVAGYLPYLYEKFAFPFVNLLIVLVVLPFALKPARSGTMATSVLAALIIGFSYYAVHSFSLALGKAELLPPLLSAWMANLVMGFVGTVLLLGSEAPN